jgi:hypothetical protein
MLLFSSVLTTASLYSGSLSCVLYFLYKFIQLVNFKYITMFTEFIISSWSFHGYKSHMSSVYLRNQVFCHSWYPVAIISVIFVDSYFFWLLHKTSWESYVMVCVFLWNWFCYKSICLVDSWHFSWHFRTTSSILIWIHMAKGQCINKVTCDKGRWIVVCWCDGEDSSDIQSSLMYDTHKNL